MLFRSRRILVRTDGARPLAAALTALEGVEQVRIDGADVVIETSRPDALALALPGLARDAGAVLEAVEPTDEDLESVYAYLTERARGVRR